MNWHNLVPYDVAEKQISWERQRMMWRARQCGLTLAEIGQRYNLSKERVRQLSVKYEYLGKVSPVERWCQQKGDIAEIAYRLRHAQR